ncbi:HhH-GPD-type base excision DNA repair protein [Dermatobacter hominis]|uniref:HhH-GPD-type base excision DNA repair protein n=1 Tax=Dermatobacter hominis TaxID=2884263 RepID=UPI001D10239C|nr:HhH-GPD-type base excision DNA repair protein [Dermatobacter hominis]UDY35514.1 Fe-S cluster assembly protein HesB [Dermatobacter hominis]
MTGPAIPITGDEAADRLLEEDPLALLVGMLLDQQVPMEWAFRGPATLKERLGGSLDATSIAAMTEDDFVAVCCEKPAIHRFPAAMGRRIHSLCLDLVAHHGGDASKLWADDPTGPVLYARLRELPGYGDEKTRIFMAILAKRLGIRPEGWEEVAAPFSDEQPRSVADVDSEENLGRVREWKKMMKAAKKAKSDPVD